MMKRQDSRQQAEYEGESELRVGLFFSCCCAAWPCQFEGRECSALGWIGSVRQCGWIEDEDDDGTRCRVGTASVLGWK